MKAEDQDMSVHAHNHRQDGFDLSADHSSKSLPTSSKTFRPILPKGWKPNCDDTTPERQQAAAHPATRRCRIFTCQRSNCNLRTHCLYKNKTIHPTTPESDSAQLETQIESLQLQQAAAKDRKSGVDLSIIRGGVDALPALPMDGLHAPVFRELFHRFFSYQYDRITTLILPPPITKNEKAAAAQKKYDTLAVALSVPAYCLNYIAATHHQIDSRKGRQGADKTTTILHSKITSLLRDKISGSEHNDTKDLVYIVFTLVMYEAANERIDALLVHRRAIDHFVASYGGVHNMETAAPYVYNLDRIIALFTDLAPRYAPRVDRSIRRPFKDPCIYGAFFDSPGSNLIHSRVKEYCFDVCRAIELIEGAGWTFDPADPLPYDSTDLHYLYFMKDCVINQYVFVNAEIAEREDVSRCMLVTAKIVDYIILQGNYFVTIPIFLANKLRGIISNTVDIATAWENHLDTLVWILFVLTCMPVPWKERPWAMTLLRYQLNLTYLDEPWPVDWRDRELKNVKRFVWSNTKLNANFGQTCDELFRSLMTITPDVIE